MAYSFQKVEYPPYTVGSSGLKFRVRNEAVIFLFLNQNIWLGCQKNRLNETVLLTPKHMLKLAVKKILTIFFILTCAVDNRVGE